MGPQTDTARGSADQMALSKGLSTEQPSSRQRLHGWPGKTAIRQLFRRCLRRPFLRVTGAALLSWGVLGGGTLPALAQNQPEPLPERPAPDANGVDLTTGFYSVASTDVVIGQPGSGGLSYSRVYVDTGWRASTLGTICTVPGEPNRFFVSMGTSSDTFTLSGTLASGTFTNENGNGATLTYNNSTGEFMYRTSDGTEAYFSSALKEKVLPISANQGILVKIKTPNRAETHFHYKTAGSIARLQSVTNTFGYQIHLQYATNNSGDQAGWRRPTKVTGINNAVDYCAPLADICNSLSQSWPFVTYNGNEDRVSSVTDALSRTTHYTYGGTGGRLSAIREPGFATNNITLTYQGTRVSQVNLGFTHFTYTYADAGDQRTTTVRNANNNATVVKSKISSGVITSTKDPANRTVSWQYDSDNRVTRVTFPEGNAVTYDYDARGNVEEVRRKAKPGSGLADLVTSATFPATCQPWTVVTCNKPTQTTDERGGVTDYVYDANHGGASVITGPAATGLQRPRVRMTYGYQSASYKSGPSSYTNGPQIFIPIRTAQCTTATDCAGSANEAVSESLYASGTGNNPVADCRHCAQREFLHSSTHGLYLHPARGCCHD